MLYLVILILVITILFLIWKGFLGERAKGVVEGICGVVTGRSKIKIENKQKILEFLQKNGKASNSELRELVGVSERTIVDYMDELEKDGKTRQIHETGRSTHYILK